MTTKNEDAAYMVLVERHIAELEERLTALKDVINAMNLDGTDTSNQTELFNTMSEAMTTVQRFREEVFTHNGNETGKSSVLP